MAKKRYPKSEVLETAQNKGEAAYVSWDGSTGPDVEAIGKFSEAVEDFVGVQHAKGRDRGGWNQDLSNLQSNTSGRPGLTKRDYYNFRPQEAPHLGYKGQMVDADMAYTEVGLIRNIIDLMADFACQGIRLVHPNKRIEKFYQNWFARVNGKDRSERFLNNLYRTGNVIVRKQTAKIKTKDKQNLFKAVAEPETEVEQMVVKKNEIPWKYNFLNPLLVEVVGGPLASFVKQPTYGFTLPRYLARMIKNAKTPEERALVAQLPKEIIQAAETNRMVPLPPERTSVYHYKKDDWHPWASPMIHAVMDDVMMLEKLRLADMAALDGAISNIRIFKIGSLEHRIVPTRIAASKLSSILEANVGGGTMDLVWGPDIELIESKTAVHQFLGAEKYTPHLNAIYAGLGIPPTLTGMSGASGTTNNFMSLKTLISRLEYGRNVLQAFWEKEIVAVQKAMRFRFPAKVEFTIMNLGDEAAEKALLIQLADRSLISDEMIQHIFHDDSAYMERIRINRENRERNEGKLVPKAGAFHDPQFGIALKKLALQTGVSTPGQMGLRRDANTRDLKTYPPEKGEQPALKMRQPPGGGKAPAKKKGVPQQGRPKNSKDSKTRKKKNFTPKTKAVVEVWARAAQVAIAKIVTPRILDVFHKKNVRKLTAHEHRRLESVKFGVLCNLEPLGAVDEEHIITALDEGIPQDIYHTYCEWMADISKDIDRKLTLDELKHVQACVYASYIGEE